MNIRPFFCFYGGKWRIAKKYPPPEHDTLIEPFAGSAGYSLRYYDRRVILVEKDEKIASVWRYLLGVSESDILRLPDIAPGQLVDDLDAPQEAKWLIGFWLNFGSAQPKRLLSNKGISGPRSDTTRYAVFWGPKIRKRISSQLHAIKHWKIHQGSFEDTPNETATWFVDPPYQRAGKYYRHGSSKIDFTHLGLWCRERRGQVIVCENEGADWLPFQPFVNAKSNNTKSGGKVSKEAIWMNLPVRSHLLSRRSK